MVSWHYLNKADHTLMFKHLKDILMVFLCLVLRLIDIAPHYYDLSNFPSCEAKRVLERLYNKRERERATNRGWSWCFFFTRCPWLCCQLRARARTQVKPWPSPPWYILPSWAPTISKGTTFHQQGDYFVNNIKCLLMQLCNSDEVVSLFFFP